MFVYEYTLNFRVTLDRCLNALLKKKGIACIPHSARKRERMSERERLTKFEFEEVSNEKYV